MAPRIHLDRPLHAGETFALPPAQSRHAQVLRLQPGNALLLFNGTGGEWHASITAMHRSQVEVRVEVHIEVDRELPCRVTLALGMPATERMDALVEKASELGAAVIQPLLCERSVLRLAGERAERRREHWRAVAVAASEQSGRTRLPQIGAVLSLAAWLRELPVVGDDARFVLSPHAVLRFERAALPTMGRTNSRADRPVDDHMEDRIEGHVDGHIECRIDDRTSGHGERRQLLFLSGPEGGLSDTEEAAARTAGFAPVSLGPRVLRADTAPLAVLAALAVFELDRE